jgi:glycosyltransferase involved in cell wall biosynthesis
MPKAVELILVMPVYNEETTIRHTIIGWGDILRDHVGQGAYQICVVNDGSTDNTLKEINLVNQERSDIVLISQQNQGHGSALRSGYEYVLSNGAEWVLQVDSDGQCDPNDFPKFWIGRSKGRVRMGFRWIRKDGLIRWLVSRIVTFQIFAVSGYWLLDANVPYRLMPQELLRIALNMAPLERLFFLNILLAVNFKLLVF